MYLPLQCPHMYGRTHYFEMAVIKIYKINIHELKLAFLQDRALSALNLRNTFA